MVELAVEDAAQFAVNNLLYARSASYQQALDTHLGESGCGVRDVGDGRYQVLRRRVPGGSPNTTL
jgi:hypothetical protein